MARTGAAVPTQVIFEDVKSVITRNQSPDIHFDLSINPYRGCEHGCSYCYARPTHRYLNLSPGLDFETKIIAERNIAEVLRRELGAPRYVPSLLNIGSATDCYQPVERDLRLTRAVIEVMQDTRHPISLITKGSGAERHLDLISPMAPSGPPRQMPGSFNACRGCDTVDCASGRPSPRSLVIHSLRRANSRTIRSLAGLPSARNPSAARSSSSVRSAICFIALPASSQ